MQAYYIMNFLFFLMILTTGCHRKYKNIKKEDCTQKKQKKQKKQRKQKDNQSH